LLAAPARSAVEAPPPPDPPNGTPPPPPQIGARFRANQTYLLDLIHPNRDVGLEVANVYLNLAAQALGA
jgi:hypothetical protein